MVNISLDIQDTLLRRGLTQLILQWADFSLEDDKTMGNLLITDKQKISAPPHLKVLYLDQRDFPLSVPALYDQLIRLNKKARSFKIQQDYFYPSEKHIKKSNAEKIILTDLEAALLSYLCEYAGQSCTKQDLLESVWEYQAEVTTHTVETHIYRLRQKYPLLETLLNTTDTGYRLELKDKDHEMSSKK